MLQLQRFVVWGRNFDERSVDFSPQIVDDMGDERGTPSKIQVSSFNIDYSSGSRLRNQ